MPVSHHHSFPFEGQYAFMPVQEFVHFRFHGHLKKDPDFFPEEFRQQILGCRLWTFFLFWDILLFQGAPLLLDDLVLGVTPFQQSAPLLAILSHTITSTITPEPINIGLAL